MSAERPIWLVTGGAGYIGAHVTRSLLSTGLEVVVIDNLSTGLIERVPEAVTMIQADCADHQSLRDVIVKHQVVGVMHLAALKQARESARKPMQYWVNNINATLGVLRASEGTSVRHFIFSSSCSIYGDSGPVNTTTPPRPLSPYARTKFASELLLQDVAPTLGLSTIFLRYFNVIGNDEFAMAHDTSTECLVPAAYTRIVNQEPVQVFGTSHPTPDGTALRDYVDVRDLASAHARAAKFSMTMDPASSLLLDVGTGKPTSVMQILDALEQEVQTTLKLEDHGAHASDPDAIWAEALAIREVLGWEPQHDLASSVKAHHRSAMNSMPDLRRDPAPHQPRDASVEASKKKAR